MAARRAHNPKVTGSNPVSATTKSGLNTTFKPLFFFKIIQNHMIKRCLTTILTTTPMTAIRIITTEKN